MRQEIGDREEKTNRRKRETGGMRKETSDNKYQVADI